MFKTLNTAGIVEKIKRNRKEKNLYQKVNNFLKGMPVDNDDLMKEVEEIVKTECDRFAQHAKNVKARKFVN